jgi:hypothetical protein
MDVLEQADPTCFIDGADSRLLPIGPLGIRHASNKGVERRKRTVPLTSGIDRRRQDEDYAERMTQGARLERGPRVINDAAQVRSQWRSVHTDKND